MSAQPIRLDSLPKAVYRRAESRYVAALRGRLSYYEDASNPEGEYLLSKLTEREKMHIRKLLQSWGSRDIAVESGITEQTLKKRLTRIYAKLSVSGKIELAMLVIKHPAMRKELCVE